MPQAAVEDERVTGVEQHLDGALGLDDRVALLLGAAGERVVLVAAGDERLGKVVGLIETGANAVLRVLGEDNVERLLPFVSAVVLAVEKEAGQIRVEWGSDW